MILTHRIRIGETEKECKVKQSGRMLVIKLPFFNKLEAQQFLQTRELDKTFDKIPEKENGDVTKAIHRRYR